MQLGTKAETLFAIQDKLTDAMINPGIGSERIIDKIPGGMI